MLIQQVINICNYYVQSLFLYDFTYRVSGSDQNYRKGLCLYAVLISTSCVLFDMIIAPLPAFPELIVKTSFHMFIMTVFTAVYLKQKPGTALIINLFMAFICSLMEILSVMIFGSLYPTQVESILELSPGQLLLIQGLLDLTEFIALRLTILIDPRRDHDISAGFQFLIAVCLLYFTLVFGSITRMASTDDRVISVSFRILIMVTMVLMNLCIFLYIRYIRKVNRMIETGDSYARVNQNISAGDQYLSESNEELIRLQNRILEYRHEFPEGSSADSIYNEFQEYIESRYTANPVIDALLRHYADLYNEKHNRLSIEIRSDVEKYMDDLTSVTLFSYLLDRLINNEDIRVNVSDSLDLMSIRIQYSGRSPFSKHAVKLIERMIGNIPHELNRSSGRNHSELCILIGR